MNVRKIGGVFATALILSTLLSACGGSSSSGGGSGSSSGDGASSEGSSGAGSSVAGSSASESSGAESSGSGAEGTRWKITIPGKSGSLCNTPTYVAYEKGFFAEEGIDVELITADFEAKKVGLNNGTISTINGDFQYFPSIEGDIEMTIVEGLHQGCIKLNVLGDSEIQTVEDLRGKTIAVDEIGGTPHQVTLLWLGQAGIDSSEVQFLPFNDGNLEVEALRQGQVDVAALWDPIATTSVDAYGLRTILDIGTDAPFAGHYCCFLYASTKVIEENPELIAAELRAYHKAQNWIYENPEEAVELVTEKQYVSIEDHGVAVDLIRSYGYPSTDDYESGAVNVKADVEYFAQALYDIGYLTMDPAEFAEKAYTYVDLSLGQQE